MKAVLKILFLLVVTGCNACGREEPEIADELQPLLGRYFRFAPNTGKFDLITEIKFGGKEDGIEDGEGGVCNKEKDTIAGKPYAERRMIAVLKQENPFYTELSLYHELGHCLHDLDHTQTGGYDVMSTMRVRNADYWNRETVDQALSEMFQ